MSERTYNRVDFHGPASGPSLIHNAIMNPREIGEYLVRNRHMAIIVVVNDGVDSCYAATLTDEERGVAHS